MLKLTKTGPVLPPTGLLWIEQVPKYANKFNTNEQATDLVIWF